MSRHGWCAPDSLDAFDADGIPLAYIPLDENWGAEYARQFLIDLEQTSDAATQVRIRNKLST